MWLSKAAICISCVTSANLSLPVCSKSGRGGMAGNLVGSKAKSQVAHGITSRDTPGMPGIMSSFVGMAFLSPCRSISSSFASMISNIPPANGHHTKTSPDFVRREENAHPHSICRGTKSGSLFKIEEDNRKGRPQFVNVQIAFVRSKHEECKRPQLSNNQCQEWYK